MFDNDFSNTKFFLGVSNQVWYASHQMMMKNLGAKIRAERKALGLTFDQFADLSGTGGPMLQRVETGAKSPTIDHPSLNNKLISEKNKED